jgi:sterol desaturase/sphingolipid hydroxylase (fatty acid hydroxylase superfamily)
MASTQKVHMKGSGTVFQNPVLERFTRTHISLPLTIFSVISIALMVYGFQKSFINAWQAPVLFVLGLLSFSLVEYVMHRFLFHLTPKNPKQEVFAYKVHGVHHDYPKDKDRLAMPIPLSLTLSTGFFFLFKLLMGNFVFGFLPGFLIGYASYLGVHYMVHAYQPPKNFFKILWVHHGIHHYKDPDNAFGVSSPIWDVVFGTMPKK